MNNLSWLLYWADVLPQLSSFMCVIGFVLFLASAFATFAQCMCSFETTGEWNGNERVRVPTDDAAVAQKFWWVRFFPVFFFFMWGSGFLVPEKETFYMIAASEAGEEVAKTPEVAKARQLINKWLDEQINPPANNAAGS